MKIKILLLLIVIIGLFLRFYYYPHYFMFGHDQDLLGWFLRSVVEERNFRLIGQETSSRGVFIGPLYYYSMIPFYLIGKLNPLVWGYHSGLISIASILSVYFVISKIFGKKEGLIAALIYSTSWLIVGTDREVVPTTPAMLWSVWFLYSVYLLLKKDSRGLLLGMFLLGLAWHINLALVLLFPVLLFPIFLSKKMPSIKSVIASISLLILPLIPYIVFELRHGFLQTSSILSNSASGGVNFIDKFNRTIELASKNIVNLLFRDLVPYNLNILFLLLMLSLLAILYTRKEYRNVFYVFTLWIALFVLFFSFNSIILSEYYLNGLNIVWIALLSFALGLLRGKYVYVGLAVVLIIVARNASLTINNSVNASGLIERGAIVEAIKDDAEKNNYPCVSVSYIASPGNELGYRYLFFYEKMHVNKPKGGSPVYTIVFPLSMVDKFDKSFGALGLIFPEYAKYSEKQVEESCSGSNANLTDPLFGFIQ